MKNRLFAALVALLLSIVACGIVACGNGSGSTECGTGGSGGMTMSTSSASSTGSNSQPGVKIGEFCSIGPEVGSPPLRTEVEKTPAGVRYRVCKCGGAKFQNDVTVSMWRMVQTPSQTRTLINAGSNNQAADMNCTSWNDIKVDPLPDPVWFIPLISSPMGCTEDQCANESQCVESGNTLPDCVYRAPAFEIR